MASQNAVPKRAVFTDDMGCRSNRRQISASSERQIRPRPCVAMKLMASGVILSAAIVRSPSFSRSSSSTTTRILPCRKSSMASGMEANVIRTIPLGRGSLAGRRGSRQACLCMPGIGRSNGLVHGVNILHAFIVQPVFERLYTLLGIHGNALFPGRAAAQHTGVIGARFGGQLQGFHELRVANASAQIDKRLLRDARRLAIQIERFLSRLRGLPFVHA